VFLLGVFWPPASARGAKWTMWIGSALGALLFALKTLHAWRSEAFGWVPAFFLTTPFMLMTFYLFAVCVALQVGLSLLWPKLPGEDPAGLSWKHPLDALKAPGWPGLADYRVVAAGVFVLMTALYVAFR
jgi:SSS family solute:Na+ symporter